MRPRQTSTLFTLSMGLASSVFGLWACSSAADGSRANPATSQDEAGSDADGSPSTDLPDAPATIGSDGGDGSSAPTAKEACIAYVNAVCAREKECGVNRFGFCEFPAELCPDVLLATGSARTLDQVVACTHVRKTQRCEEVRAGFEPACAITPGTLPADAQCHFDSQCASLRCSFGNAGSCGVCAAIQPPATGCPTGMTTCGPNMHCTSPSLGCAPIVVPTTLAAGTTCAADAGADAQACPSALPCASTGADAATGTCSMLPSSGQCLFALASQYPSLCARDTYCVRPDPLLPDGECRPLGTKDEPCGSSVGGRPCADGLFCTNNSRGTCQPRHKLNEPCQGSSQCDASLFCQRNGLTGTCVPRLQLGEDCSPADGADFYGECEGEAQCLPLDVDGGPKPYLCMLRAGLGESCNSTAQPCSGSLSCQTGSCTLLECAKDAGGGG